MQQRIEIMIGGAALAPVEPLIGDQRQHGHRLGQDPHAGIDRRHSEGLVRADRDPGVGQGGQSHLDPWTDVIQRQVPPLLVRSDRLLWEEQIADQGHDLLRIQWAKRLTALSRIPPAMNAPPAPTVITRPAMSEAKPATPSTSAKTGISPPVPRA